MTRINAIILRASSILLLICAHHRIFSQTVAPSTNNAQGLLPNVMPQSPEAASLGKFGEYPVSEYTGVPNISVPIYSIKLKGLEVPIQLSYHAGGIKVDEISSWVGAGWALNAGGAITRTVVGLADDDVGGLIQQYQAGNYLKGSYDLSNQDDYVFFWRAMDQQVDLEPDIYYYNFAGASGKFCFDSTGAFHAIPANTLRIIQSPFLGLTGTTVSNTQWLVADDKGNNYYFGSTDVVAGTGGGVNGVERTNSGIEPLSVSNSKITAWYLTKIITADKSDTVYFDYGLKNEFYIMPPVMSLRYVVNRTALPDGNGTDWNAFFSANTFLYNGKNQGAATLLSSTAGASTLKKIRWRGGEIDFAANTVRQDALDSYLAGAYMLDSVNVYNEFGNRVKSFNLNYSFVQNRYFLDSLKEFSTDKTPPLVHNFSYNNRNLLPPTTSTSNIVSFQQDHWGYFNGTTGAANNSLLPFSSSMPAPIAYLLTSSREPDTIAMQYGVLNKISYPTGGSTAFEYQSNRYDPSTAVGGTPPASVVTTVTKTDNTASSESPYQNNITFTSAITQANISITVTVYKYEYHAGTLNASPVPYIMFGPQGDYDNHTQYYTNAYDNPPPSGTSEDGNGIFGTYSFTINNLSLLGGQPYILMLSDSCFKPINCASDENPRPYMTATITYQDYAPAPPTGGGTTPLPIAGGLRIKQITNYDIAGNFINRKHYSYAPGNLLMYPTYVRHYQQDVAYFLDKIDAGGSGYYYCSQVDAELLEESSTSQTILGFTQSSPVAYTQVTESDVDISGNDNGYTNYTFSFFPDSLNILNFDLTYWSTSSTYIGALSGIDILNPTVPSNSFEFKRGLLLSKDVFKRNVDNTYAKISSLANDYNFNEFNPDKHYARIRGLRLQRLRSPVELYACGPLYGPYEMPLDGTAPDFTYSFYDIISGWVQNVSSTQTLWDQNGQNPVTSTTNTYYDNPVHMQPTRMVTTRSSHDSIVSLMNYPQDYAAGTPFIDAMSLANEISTPIESVKYEVTPAGATNILGGKITTFLPDGRGLVDRIKLMESPTPVALSNFTFSNTASGKLPYSVGSKSAFSPDSRYVDKVVAAGYDGYANPVQQYKVSDVNNSYVWDYNHLYPIAQVTNASATDIAYTSFEADGSGGWTVAGTSVDATHAITGNTSYILTSGSISKSGLNSSTTYIVSYWTNNGSAYTITGTVSGYPKKGKSTGGWTYCEHQVTGLSTITIGGTGSIDELRLYPVGAQMTSYTYTPLVGITSQADVSSRITYYEYDGLQRLKRIRDQDRNILKSFDYQYQGVSGCTGNCYILGMQTLNGSATIGYPVGVFSVSGKLLGNAATQTDYITLWNGDTGDGAIGTLAVGADPLHFQFTLNAGKTLPAGVTGCRYYQVDLAYTKMDGVRNMNGAYVDFGDGTGMRLGTTATSTDGVVLPPYTTENFFPGDPTVYFVHTYPLATLKTLTFYHNDDANGSPDFDNATVPANSLPLLTNLRGNVAIGLNVFGGSCYQQAGMLTVANLTDWNSVTSIGQFRLVNGDYGAGVLRNLNYAQDFMKNNKSLYDIETGYGPYGAAYRDLSFKISRLKSDWNTYFTDLQKIWINDDHWDREDLSALKKLNYFALSSTTASHDDTPGSPLVPIPTEAVDNMILQIAGGAGLTISNGIISIGGGGTARSAASDAAVTYLKSKGWTVNVNGVPQ